MAKVFRAPGGFPSDGARTGGHESEFAHRYHALAEAIDAIVLEARADGRPNFYNQRWFDYTGLTAEQTAAGSWLAAVHPEDRAGLPATPFAVGGERWEAEFRLRRHDGEYRWHLGKGVPSFDEQGKVAAWIGIATDIHDHKLPQARTAHLAATLEAGVTDKRRAEADVRGSEARHREFLEGLPLMAWATDNDWRITYSNRKAVDYLGGASGHPSIEARVQMIHEDDRAASSAARMEAARDGAMFEVEERIRRADGEYRWFLRRGVPLRDAEGGVSGWFNTAMDIHERRLAEEALRQAEARYRGLVSAIPAFVSISDNSGHIRWVNDRWMERSGLTLAETQAGQHRALVHPEDRAAVRAAWARGLARREPFTTEFRLPLADGIYRWHTRYHEPVSDGAGRDDGWVSVTFDIHDRKLAEEALVAREAEWRALAEEIPALIDRTDVVSGAVYMNRQLLAYSGLTTAQVAADVFSATHPDDVERVRTAWDDAAANRRAVTLEWRVRRWDGVYRWHMCFRTPVLDGAGNIVTWIGGGIDIEETKQVQEALRASEERYRSLAAAITSVVWTAGPDGGFTVAQPSWEAYTGQDWDAHAGAGWAAAIHPDDRERVQALWRQATANGTPYESEGRIWHAATGDYRAFVARAVPIREAGGALREWVGTVSDVDEQRQAEERVLALNRELEARVHELQTLLEVIPVGIGIARDPEANDIRVNAAFARMLRIPPDVNASTSSGEGDPLPFRVMRDGEEVRAADLPLQVAARTGETVADAEFEIVYEDGSVSHLLEFAAPVFGEDGRPRGSIGAFVDVTERRRAEEALAEANSVKDDFLGLVSHELRTPLTTIAGIADVLGRRFESLGREAREEAIGQLQTDSDRLQRLIENMLILARLEKVGPETEPVLLQRVIPVAVATLARTDRRTQVTTTFEDGLPPVLAQSTWVDQLLQNLLSNAAKYGGGKEEVRIDSVREGEFVAIRVLDRGAGIDPDEVESLFQPFFRGRQATTATPGAGLGLAVCKRLVELQGGRIWAAARPGGGTEMGFTLPVALDPGE
ncbi:MAG: PAS domain-containing protein [Tepidiformaceae bacterium]